MRPLDHLLNWRGFAVVCFLLLSLAHASAYSQATCLKWNTSNCGGEPVFDSAESALLACAYQIFGAESGVTVRVEATSPTHALGFVDLNNGTGESTFGSAVGSPCPPTGCAATAGTTREVNFTLGWTRTANADDYGFVGGQNSIPTSACHAGCTVGVLTAQRTWVSPTPSPDGLYRHSADLLVIGTDSSCSATTPAMESTSEDKECDGTVGYVNGKRTCVKASSAPDPVQPAPAPEKIGNPTAGSPPNATDANNPAGREPTGGTGGNLGGPPSGESGGQPRGTGTGPATGGAGGAQTIKVEIPDFKDPCGIPGAPPCKIDETGTPGNAGITGAAAGIGTAGSGLMDAVNGVDKPTSLGWSFSVTLPAAACAPFQFWKPGGTWEVNICSNSAVLLLRDMLAWAMAILAAVYVWRGVTATVRGE